MRIFILSFFIALFILPLSAQHTVLYGTTQDGGDSSRGTIIRFDATSGIEMVVWSFKGHTDGADPLGDLVTGPADGLFYGMTYQGGTYNIGTIFSFDPVSNTERVLWSFGGGSDGTNPSGDLIYDSQTGLFYGLATEGGTYSQGVIFSFDPASGAERDVWAFGNTSSDGTDPPGSLVSDPANGLFYGMANGGGNNNDGVIFSFNPSNDSEQVLYSFNGTTGRFPIGNLTYDSGSRVFYGMTGDGGSSNIGTIFVFDPSANSETPVWNFGAGSDGEYPDGSLIYNPSTGAFYGMTPNGGIDGDGIMFSFDTGFTETVLWSFGMGQDGAQPHGNLTYDPASGMLYGMTEEGGTNHLGTIFSFDPSTNTEDLLWSFGIGNDGQYPGASLTLYTGPNGIKNISTSVISISPNPTSGIVSLSGLISGQTIAVYDYLGQRVSTTTADKTNAQIDLASHESGVYMVTVLNSDGSVLSQKKVVKVN